MKSGTLLLVPCVLALFFRVCRSQSVKTELIHNLLVSYDKLTIPSDHVTVNLGLAVLAVPYMDEDSQMFAADVWLEMKWTDERLRWEPDVYNGVTSVRLPTELLWMPDIMVYGPPTQPSVQKVNGVINNDGTILVFQPMRLQSYCTFGNLTEGETIKCAIKVGSWTYNGLELDIQERNTQVDLSNFKVSARGWTLLGVTSERNVAVYTCCPEPYIDIQYIFNLQKDADQ